MFNMQKNHAENQAIDLALLPLLRALLDTASITRAGERLGLSQSAASRAVARLRTQVGDPLLVRTASGYVLTPLAESLRANVQAALSAADKVFRRAPFVPTSTLRRFRIASTDYGVLTAITPLLAELTQRAPQVGIEVTPWNERTLSQLENGELDLALYADSSLPPDFHARDLWTERYTAMVRSGHPLVASAKASKGGFVSWAQIAKYPQVVARYPEGRDYQDDDLLRETGINSHHVLLAAPYFAAAAQVIATTDAVMVVPNRIAEINALQWRVVALPIKGGTRKFAYRLVWHERAHHDPGVRWLRGLITARHVDIDAVPA